MVVSRLSTGNSGLSHNWVVSLNNVYDYEPRIDCNKANYPHFSHFLATEMEFRFFESVSPIQEFQQVKRLGSGLLAILTL
jgi:hypothetical protein